MVHIPKVLWYRTVFVRNRVSFIDSLQKGEIDDFIDTRSCSKERCEELLSQGWQLIRFGLNCVIS